MSLFARPSIISAVIALAAVSSVSYLPVASEDHLALILRLDAQLSGDSESLEQDMLQWIESETRSPAFLQRARTDPTLSYASLALTTLENGGDFVSSNYGGSLLPMRHQPGRASPINYQLTLPKTYFRDAEQFPLVIELPGLGWTNHRLGYKRVNQGSPYSQIINVIPVKASFGRWDVERLSAFLDHLQRVLRVDPDRVYLLGHSVGGYAAWEWAKREPERFAAVAPCSTWGNPFQIDQLTDMPVLLMHGLNDRVISADFTIALAEKLRREGGQPESRIFDDSGHDFIDERIRKELFCWLMEHARDDRWGKPSLLARAEGN